MTRRVVQPRIRGGQPVDPPSAHELVAAALRECPTASVRKIAALTGLSKSRVHRLMHEGPSSAPAVDDQAATTPEPATTGPAPAEDPRWIPDAHGVPAALAGRYPQRSDWLDDHPRDRGVPGWCGPWR